MTAAGATAPSPGRLRPDPSLISRMTREVRDLVRFRHLIRYLVMSALHAENMSTTLGMIWWVVDPLLMAAIYTMFVAGILHAGGNNFPLYVFVAILTFTFFSRVIQGSMGDTLNKERSMRQVSYPKTTIPIGKAIAETVHFGFGIVVLLVLAMAWGVYPTRMTPLIIPLTIILFAFALGLAFLLTPLNMHFRDTKHLVVYGLWLWFHLSPSMYRVSRIPQHYRWIYNLNPITIFYGAYRNVLINGDMPNWSLERLGGVTILSFAMLIAGFLVFVRAERTFARLV